MRLMTRCGAGDLRSPLQTRDCYSEQYRKVWYDDWCMELVERDEKNVENGRFIKNHLNAPNGALWC